MRPARLRAIVEASPLPTLVLARDLTLELMNTPAKALLGLTAQEMGTLSTRLAPREEGEAGDLEERLRHGEPIDGEEARLRRADGVQIPVAVYARPLDEAHGGEMAVTMFDLRERDREARESRILADLLQATTAAGSEQDVLDALAQRVSDAVTASLAIYRVDETAGELEVVTIKSHDDIADAFQTMYARQRWRLGEGFMGAAVATGQTVFHPYLSPAEREEYLNALPEDRRRELAARDLRAIIAIPLTQDHTRFGVLTLARYGDAAEPFTERDLCFTEELATAANLALTRIAAADRRAREGERQRLLAEFLAAAVQATDERTIFEELAMRSAAVLDAACIIYRVTPDGGELNAVGYAGYDAAPTAAIGMVFAGRRWRADEGIAGAAYTTGETVFIPYMDPARQAAYLGTLPREHRRKLAAYDIRAAIGVPLQVDGLRIGSVTITRYGGDACAFEETDLSFAVALAAHASVALARLSLVAAQERTRRILQTIFDASPLATQLLDRDGKVLLWNGAAERLFGFSAEEAVGKSPPTIPPDEMPAALDIAHRVLRGEIVEGLPAVRVRKDRSAIDVELYGALVPDEQGEARILGIYADVTERNRLDAELRRTSDTLRAILDASPLPIVALDDAMRVTFWNGAAERLYGWRAGEVVGDAAPFMPDDEWQVHRSLFAQVVSGAAIDTEVRHRTKDGRVLDVHVYFSPLRDEHGQIRGALSVHEDVTERERLEAELLQAQKMETVGRLAGGVAHDFNNILTAIIGYTDVAAQLASNDEQARLLATVKSAAERAAGLTAQLLAFSRRQMLQPSVVDANEVVLRMEPILQRLIGEDVELVASVVPDVGSVLVDPTQLEQVILNLAVNARDAMPGGGKLVLRTETAHFNGDHAHLEMAPGNYVVIHVSDTGIGMDEETKAHIFEPFFTTKGVGQGTGLGLSTTYGIVRQSGGYIWVYSEPGRGTTFKLYFPRVGSPPQPAAPEPDQATQPRRGRILLVEDEEVLRSLGTLVLSRRGYEVTVARHPADAVALAADASFDLLATDVVMPGMTGIELARRLRERQPDLRVLFMSGYSEDVTDPAGSMVRKFLAKPFTPDSLLRAVDEAMAGDRSAG